MALRTEESPHNCLKNATLEDFYQECTKDGVKHILNVLDLPMGAADLPSVPQFRSELLAHLIKLSII
jgi:hypothetical protein